MKFILLIILIIFIYIIKLLQNNIIIKYQLALLSQLYFTTFQIQQIIISDIDGIEHIIKIQQHLLQENSLELLQQQLSQFVPLQKFVSQLNSDLYELKSIIINSIDYFGKRIGFLKLIVDATNKLTGKKIPGIVQLRGGSVAILIETYNLDTHETKMPTGANLLEIPAGMLDGNGDISGVAIKEIQEETGIKINSDKLQYLGKAYSSPGLLDEMITYFQLKINFTQKEIEEIESKIYGEENSNETIKLVFYDLKQTEKLVDGKFYTAIGLKTIKNI